MENWSGGEVTTRKGIHLGNCLLKRLLPVRADEGLDMQGLVPALEAESLAGGEPVAGRWNCLLKRLKPG